MKQSSTLIVLCATFALGLGLGYILFHQPSETILTDSTSGNSPGNPATDNTSSTHNQPRRESRNDTPLFEHRFSSKMDDLVRSATTPQGMQRLIEEISKFSNEDFMELFDIKNINFHKHPNASTVLKVAALQWAQSDLDSVLELLSSAPRHVQWDLIQPVADELSKRHDLSTALQITDSMPNMYTRNSLKNSIIQSYAMADPKGAFEYAQKNFTTPQDYWVTSSIFTIWALSHPEEAKAEALRLSNPRHRRQALSSVGSSLAAMDPQAAIMWAETIPNKMDQQEVLHTAITAWATSNPVEAAEYAVSLPPGQKRNQTLLQITMNWVELDPLATLNWAQENMTGDSLRHTVTSAIGHIAKSDLLQARQLIESLPYGSTRSQALNSLSYHIPEDQLIPTLNWIRTQPRDSSSEHTLRIIGQQIAQRDQATAERMLTQDIEPPLRASLIQQLAQEYAQETPEKALAWIRQFDETENESALRSIMHTWANTDPIAVVEHIQTLGNDEEAIKLLPIVTRQLAGEVPQETARLLQSIPDEDNQLKGAYRSLAQTWVYNDSMEASIWIDSLPEGPNRDAAASSLINYLANNDPESGFQWALSLSDKRQRETYIHHTFTQLKDFDPHKAEQLINTPDLTDKEVKELRKILEKK